jgi:hypothetical protein
MTEPQQRECGGCTLCCRLLPVVSLNKPGGVRCKHQRFRTGCAIHRKKGFPGECALWSCRWLVTDIDLPRPDHGHYCVDIVPDYITAKQPGRGDISVPVIQIWNDPHYPDAHRDPRLRKWLEAMCRAEGWCALVRFSPSEALMLIPPLMSDSHQWEEVGDTRMTVDETTHSGEDIASKLAKSGIYPTMEVDNRDKVGE